MFFRKPKKYLIVCSKNRSRSKYAECWLREFCYLNNINVKVKSAGLKVTHSESTQLELSMVEEANKFFVMEEIMKKEIIKTYQGEPNKIINLEIPNIFSPAKCYKHSKLDDLTPEEAEKTIIQRFAEIPGHIVTV